MKPIMTLFAFCLFSLFSLTEISAQSKTDFGFKVGLGASGWNQEFIHPGFSDYYSDYYQFDYQFGSSYTIAAYVQQELNPHFDFFLELGFTENGNKFRYKQGPDFTSIIDHRIGQIQIPIGIKWNFNKKNNSPYLKAGLSSNYIVRDQKESTIYSLYENNGWLGGDYLQSINLSEKKFSVQSLWGFGWDFGSKMTLEATVLWGNDFAKTENLYCYCYFSIDSNQTIHHNRSFMLNFYYALSKS